MDGLAMGASLAVTLANIWMKSFEDQIKSTKEIINKFPKNDLEASLKATVESSIEERSRM